MTGFTAAARGRFFPDLWARFLSGIPVAEQGNPIAAYHRRLFSGDLGEEMRLARLWTNWENALASIQTSGVVGEGPSDYARAFARLESHYFINRCFLEHDGWIMANRHRIEGINADIVQGRYDMICPPQSAWQLADGWEKARLRMVAMSGHALSEAGITAELVDIMNRLRG